MVETLFFDLDNTLLDFNRAERAAIAKTLKSFHIAPEPSVLKRYSELNLAQWKLLEQGKITRDQVKLRRFQLLFAELNVDIPAKEAAHTYETLLAQGHYFIDGAEELLETLYGQYRMYLVTNGTLSVQKGRLKSSGISRYFGHPPCRSDAGQGRRAVQLRRTGSERRGHRRARCRPHRRR